MERRPRTPEEVLARSREAWDAGDADAYARLFTEDATYVIFRGDVLLGREQIRQAHQELFTRWQPGSRLIVKAIRTTELDDATAVILAAGGIGEAPVAYDKFQTLTLVREPDGWSIAAFQNTEMSDGAKERYRS